MDFTICDEATYFYYIIREQQSKMIAGDIKAVSIDCRSLKARMTPNATPATFTCLRQSEGRASME
jgi:hypothetical protein